MTEIIYDEDTLTIIARGHAGSGPYGDDLACCSVSTLAETLVAALQERNVHRVVEIDEGSGLMLVQAFPREEEFGAVSIIFSVIAAGMSGIANEYPEHVSFRRGGD